MLTENQNISLENWLCNQIIWHKKNCGDRPGNYQEAIYKCEGLLWKGFPIEAWHCLKSEVIPAWKKDGKMKLFIKECLHNNQNYEGRNKTDFLILRGCD